MDNRELARRAVDLARKAGAKDAMAGAYRSRQVTVEWRDGKVDRISEATQRSLSIDLYVDGRYGEVNTNDLRPEALERFLAGAVATTRALAVDKDRRLPDPELYRGRSDAALDLDDPAQAAVTSDERKRFAAEMEAAARSVPGAEAIISVSTSMSDGLYESVGVSSNGFEGATRSTSFSAAAEVSVRDGDRRPEQASYATARFRSDLPAAATIGRDAGERTMARRGVTKGQSAVQTVIVENRVAGRLVSMLLGPLSGEALQQKRSFLDGKLGEPLASKIVSITDQPFLRRGLGSRHFDSEGLALKPRAVIEDGVLRSYFIATYYGRKLGVAPTTEKPSNLDWKLGDRSLAELLASAGDGLLVTSFIGGNSNGATGDFSLGLQGVRIVKGKLAEPVGEMNLSGNQKDLWKRVVAVGNDPFRFNAMRTPSLVFDGLQIAGL